MEMDAAAWRALLEPAVAAMGCELVGVEYHPRGRHSLLRVYIDREGGVTVDDCAAVSEQISGVLDVEDPIHGQYSLEVSSPGLDRPLFTAADFVRFAGHDVRVRLRLPQAGRRRFAGRLLGCEDGEVRVRDAAGELFRLPLADIEEARLVPEYD